MTNKTLKEKTLSGILWTFLNKMCNQGLSFMISVILARLLSPDDFGVVALAGMFTVLLGIFSEGGLGEALIQKKDADEKDYNTLFYTQFVFSICIYLIIFFAAPYFASFYEKPILTDLIRVSALTMPLGALSGVQNSIVTRRLMFKWYFYANIISLIISGSIGLYLAYDGYGAWALVIKTISSTVVSTIVVWCLLDWHPKFQFDYNRFKILFKNGVKFMTSSFIGTLNYQLKGYLLGWKYSSSDLAFFNRGEGLPNLVCGNINNTIQGVLFPVMSKMQDDKEAVRKTLRRAITTSSFILYPLLFGLIAICDKLVVLIFSEKWAPCVPYMRGLCICYIISFLCENNLQVLKATGQIGIVIKLEFIKKPLGIIILIITAMISPMAIVYGFIVMNIITFIINSYPNAKHINYSLFDQIRDIAPSFCLSLFMAIVVYLQGLYIKDLYLSIIIQIITGIIIYISSAYILRLQIFYYVVDTLRKLINKNHSL